MKVKICGIRDVASARGAADAGADLIGFVFAPTRRQVPPELAAAIIRELPSSVGTVGVFVDEEPSRIRAIADACRLDYIQLCGDEPPELCEQLGRPVIKSLKVRGPDIIEEVARYAGVVAWCILEGFQPGAHGGTGASFDWRLARAVTERYTVMLAGGLTPENVEQAIQIARPWGVDVSSGVETNGQKDIRKIAAFISAAKACGLALDRRIAGGGAA